MVRFVHSITVMPYIHMVYSYLKKKEEDKWALPIVELRHLVYENINIYFDDDY